jgi:two-component system, OmpR family, copper resistance phosphate regulon response regulator CusR
MRILVIEDEPRILSFLARGLEAEGFAVDGAADGKAGVDRAVRGAYDLVILDLLLPKLDGFAVLRQLQNRLPELPIVIVSARSELETKLRGFDLGACDYLSKPFSFDELLARVRAQLRRGRPGETGSVVRAGLLSLDVARRQAKLGDVVATLSDREFRLLHHLVLHEGEVVSRERLLADVWGYHFDPGSNVVEVCIRRLRQKLGSDAIETVRHGGYRLVAA